MTTSSLETINNAQVLRLVVVLCLFGQIAGECNVCQTNQAACINSTSFYLCFGDATPHTDRLYHCLEGFHCTTLTAICAQKSVQRPPSCGDTTKCGQCSAHRNYLFTCQSRGIFQMCYGATQPTGPYGYCPTGSVCDAESDAICVPEMDAKQLTCDLLDELVDTTTTKTTATTSSMTTTTDTSSETSTSNVLSPIEVCEQKRQSGLFPTVPQDPYCQHYIYCYFKSGIIRATEYTCAANSYFEKEFERCSYIKPNYCI